MPRLTNEDRQKILADFHTGAYSHRQLANRYNCSHVAIGKIVKGLEPKHKDKVDNIVSSIVSLGDESYQQVNSINSVVTEKIKHITFFDRAILWNQNQANKYAKKANNIFELNTHSQLTVRNKEAIVGKQPDVLINNQNTNNNALKASIKINKETVQDVLSEFNDEF